MAENTGDWRDGLSPDQIRAAEYIGSHARLLAGPGTGKTRTLIRRVLALIMEHSIAPGCILILTFTRLAAYQLREELRQVLEPLDVDLPQVSTLHSFALRQLLRNSERIEALPKPLRIADDWEERHIIQENIKEILEIQDVREVRRLLVLLSADWDSLSCEESDWEQVFPDARFLGAWEIHRQIFGYTLRSELVYQLKRALNQYPDFDLEAGYQHLLVDEYQDLNACDLAIINELVNKSIVLFGAGDDDQSIYGFRCADPTGIREFLTHYQGAEELILQTCFRCDRSILRLAEFVADQDTRRLPKLIEARTDAGEGEVHIQCYRDQSHEARGVAELCRRLTEQESVELSEILVLIRSDYRKSISSPLSDAFREANIPVADSTEEGLLETESGRLVLATLKLLQDRDDSLAWYTMLKLETNRIGSITLKSIRDLAQDRHVRFASMLYSIRDDSDILSRFGTLVAEQVGIIEERLLRLSDEELSLAEKIEEVTTDLIADSGLKDEVAQFLRIVATESDSESLSELLQALSASLDRAEQELVPNAINILTMHKAKGLTADTVIIVGAEDEYIPGRNESTQEGDERRLLYVSMTRARHRLFMTYCQRRIGNQIYTGRNSGTAPRHLSRFLRHAPITVQHM